jgi:hypothetical protein
MRPRHHLHATVVDVHVVEGDPRRHLLVLRREDAPVRRILVPLQLAAADGRFVLDLVVPNPQLVGRRHKLRHERGNRVAEHELPEGVACHPDVDDLPDGRVRIAVHVVAHDRLRLGGVVAVADDAQRLGLQFFDDRVGQDPRAAKITLLGEGRDLIGSQYGRHAMSIPRAANPGIKMKLNPRERGGRG